MNGTPEISGYQFDQRLLAHPLAEIWRGRGFTGMEVIALVLSEAGATDPVVRSRLEQASRSAAFDSGVQQTPLWAANLTADRPYAITRLVPGESGAERLLDPLDGILGNDTDLLEAVRVQLAQYGVAPLPTAESPAEPVQAASGSRGKVELVQEKLGGWFYLVVVVAVLIVFTVTYSVGAAIGSATKDKKVGAPPAGVAASPGPYPSPAVKPGVPKPSPIPYKRPDGSPGIVGAAFPAGADVQLVGADLPFVFGWPRPPTVINLGETSTAMYRRVRLQPVPVPSALDAKLALQNCANLAACVSGRAKFEQDWTSKFKLPAPANAKGTNTWVTIQSSRPYTLTMSRIFVSNGQWWLLGVGIIAGAGEEPTIQQILNDIYRQTT